MIRMHEEHRVALGAQTIPRGKLFRPFQQKTLSRSNYSRMAPFRPPAETPRHLRE